MDRNSWVTNDSSRAAPPTAKARTVIVYNNSTSSSTPTTESITAMWKDGRVGTYRGVKEGAVKYSATVFSDKGVSTAGIYGQGVPVNGVVPTNDRFFKGGPVPVSPAETLEIFALMQAAQESKAQNGAVVRLKNLWEAK